MNVKSGLSENFQPTSASNFWYCLTKSGEVDFRISPTFGLKLRPKSGSVPIIPIGADEDISTMPLALPMLPGVLPSTPVLLTLHGVLDVHTPPNAASTAISFIAEVRSICGVNLTVAIPGFVGRDKKRMFRKLNNFCSYMPLLVWVTVSW